MKIVRSALVAAMIGGLALSGLTFAGPGPGPGDCTGPQGPDGEHMYHPKNGDGKWHDKFGGEAVPGRMVEKLNLTDEQREKIEAIRAEARQESGPLVAKMKEAAQAEREAFESGSGEQELKKLAEKAADARVELMLQARVTEAKIRKVLTPEQNTQLDELKAARKARREERMKDWKERMEEQQHRQQS